MTFVTRFAPSPTGYLHIGNARLALWNELLTRQAAGRFILRLDDTDTARSRPEFAEAIHEDLAWLGIVPDLVVRQSDRLDRYAAAFDQLKQAGLLYPAYETADELEKKRKRQQSRGLPPVYDRAALSLTEQQRQALEAEGRQPHWRFRLSGDTVRWRDAVRDEAHIETSALSDPILVRGDGSVLYTFASVVDDAEMGITHVIRGEDHVANTAVQIELFAALRASLPVFGHINLIAAADGTEMSKRTGSLSLRSFRQAGIEPMAVASVAVLTGTSEPVRAVATLAELAKLVDVSKLSRALTRFDPAEIGQLSARLVHQIPFQDAAPRLERLGISGEKAQPFWEAVRANLSRVDDAADWWPVVAGELHRRADDAAFLSAAAGCLPAEPWGEATWTDWSKRVGQATGRKGRELFLPLRLALTGHEHGPEMKALLPLIGRERALARLSPKIGS